MAYYFEKREKPTNQTAIIMADIMRHLHVRQYLGKSIVICDNSFSALRNARKQWLKLSRIIQKQRSSTVNVDKILRHTYTITHMQHMQFSAKSPIEAPDTHVFFCTPDSLPNILPANTFTVYITTQLNKHVAEKIIEQLPSNALLVDYSNLISENSLNLHPKSELEKNVDKKWRSLQDFFKQQQIDIDSIANSQMSYVDTMDDALDALLSVNHDFLQLASNFQHCLELAQPLKMNIKKQQLFNTLSLLAYRVQALTPGSMNDYFMRNYQEKDTFFLHDAMYDLLPEDETLEETVLRHKSAGRDNLANAIAFSRFERVRY